MDNPLLMDYSDLIDEYGTCAKAASELEYNRQTVHRWKAAGIPDKQQLEIQKKNPKLRADRAIVKKYLDLLGLAA